MAAVDQIPTAEVGGLQYDSVAGPLSTTSITYFFSLMSHAMWGGRENSRSFAMFIEPTARYRQSKQIRDSADWLTLRTISIATALIRLVDW